VRRGGGVPTVPAAPALAHIDDLVAAFPGATPTHVARLAGLSSSVLPKARQSGRVAVETSERLQAVRIEHLRLMPPPLVPSRYAGTHVQGLMDETGLPASAVVRALRGSVSHQTVYNVLGRGPRRYEQIKFRLHSIIVATTADEVRGADAWCDRRATIVRLRALQANGWPLSVIGPAYGMNLTNLVKQPEDTPMWASLARRIEAMYLSIGDQPGPSVRSMKYARGLGFKPPIYYDEDMRLIEVEEETEHEREQREARLDLCILGLTLDGRSVAQIAQVLGVTDKAISAARRRGGLAVTRNFAGDYIASEREPGAIAAIRAALRDVHYRSTLDVLDADGLDYAALLREVTTVATATAA